MELNIIKNTESAPSMGSTFGQDVEPKGTYVREKTNFVPSGWIEGKAIINKPLIIPINDETLVSWKYEVSDQFKAKGKKLTNKLMAMGFDAIITRYPEGDTGEIILFPNCKFIMSENNTKSLIKKMLKEALIENRELGKSLASQIKTPYVTIYRAAPMEANEFYDRDYVTLSKKFAVEHAENNHVYHEEPYHVIEALVSTSNIFNASNPGEYFYSGPNKKAREIYVSKGPYDYEGYDEISETLIDEDKIKNLKLKAYHGSPTNFSNFSDEFVGGKEATDQNGPGIYFTSSEDEAYGYASENGVVYSVELSPRIIYDDKVGKLTITPAIVKKLVMMAEDWKGKVENYDYPYTKGLIEFLKSSFNYNDNDKDILLQVWVDFYRYDGVGFVRNCVKLGIDGIMVNDEYRDTTHYIIYNPNIIKIIK